MNRRRGNLLEMKRTPTFSEYADKYIEYYQPAKDAKKASTLETETYTINQWKKHLGHLRLEQIKRIHIDGFIAARQKAGKSARTVNLEVTIFRNVMKRAIDQKIISRLPTENLRPLKLTAQKRQLFERKEIEKLLAALRQPIFVSGKVAEAGQSGQALKNEEEVADYRQSCVNPRERSARDDDWLRETFFGKFFRRLCRALTAAAQQKNRLVFWKCQRTGLQFVERDTARLRNVNLGKLHRRPHINDRRGWLRCENFLQFSRRNRFHIWGSLH